MDSFFWDFLSSTHKVARKATIILRAAVLLRVVLSIGTKMTDLGSRWRERWHGAEIWYR